MKKIIIILVLLAILAGAFLMTNGFGIASGEEKTVTISAGMTGTDISELLYENGIIKSRIGFKIALKISGKGQDIKVGDYVVSPGMPYSEIIEILTGYSSSGLIKVTVPEGTKLEDTAKLFEVCVPAQEFLEVARTGEFDYAFLKDIPRDDNYLEGFLFPETYFVEKTTSAEVIINMMLKEFEKVYTEDLLKEAEKLGYNTREIITLASVIEKEGVSELDKISSVFHNRLNIGMRLESCATVNYLFDEPKDVLSLEDTHIESPFNTYRNEGLPPSPICSPGKNAIIAAIYPAETDYLFFISNGEGENLFSKTFEEHVQKKGR